MAGKREKEELTRILERAQKTAEMKIRKIKEEKKEGGKERVEVRKAPPRKRAEETIVTWGNKILDEGFTMIPNVLIENYRKIGIRDTQMLILMAIMRFSFRGRKPFPAQKTLGQITGYSKSTVIRAIKELKLKGYITVTKRYIKRTNENPQRTSNKYNLTGLMEKLNSLEV